MKCVKLRTCGSYLIPSFLLLTAHYSFEVTTTIGIAVGGGLALLFCGMSLVFVTIRRTKRGKDHSKASKVENYKSTPKGGIIFYKMHIWKSMTCLLLYCIFSPNFSKQIILKLIGFQVSIMLRRIWVNPKWKKTSLVLSKILIMAMQMSMRGTLQKSRQTMWIWIM